MNEQQHRDQADEAFARLQASDPASDAALDRDVLRHEVDRRIADTDIHGALAEGGGAVVTPIRRPRTRWLQVAAAVAGVAVVGGAGFWAGRGTEPTTTAAPAISLQQGANSAAADSAESLAVDRMWSPGRVVFQAGGGLGDATTTATAWGFDAQAVLNAEQLSRIAEVLGVAGDPVEQDGNWTVGAQDGSAPSVSLFADGTASLSYYDPARDPWMCAQSSASSSDGEVAVEPGVAVEPTECATGGEAPTGDAAVAELREVMTALGVDPAGFQFAAPESYDQASTYVSAERVVDGQSTGLWWSANVVADGVQSLSGQMAPLVELGSYDVIGATSAVQRMADPRFGSGWGGVMPLATADTAEGAATLREGTIGSDPVGTAGPDDTVTPAPDEAATSAPDDTTMAAPDDTTTAAPDDSIAAPTDPSVLPGGPIEWPVQTVTITEARLGLAQVVQSNGAVVLAPSYAFTGDDGSQWSVIAVAESDLAIG